MRFFVFFFTVLILVPVVSLADTYSVTPPVIEHEVSPRDMLEDSIKISNTGTVPVKIFPSVHTITLGEDGSIKSFESPVMTDQTRNVSSWIAISRARLELQPGESVKVPVSITINPAAVPGDYYAYIGFGSGDKRDEAEASVIAGNAPGVTMRISLADTHSEYLRLHSFKIDRYVTGNKTVPVTYELENIGDTPVTPKGEIIFYDVRGREVSSIQVNSEEKVIAPNEKVEFTNDLPDTGVYGRHKAFLSLEYGQNQRANLYDTTFFTVIPIKLLVVVFGLLMLMSVILTILYIFRTRNRHQQHDDESVSMYVRKGVHSDLKDHDINLKNN